MVQISPSDGFDLLRLRSSLYAEQFPDRHGYGFEMHHQLHCLVRGKILRERCFLLNIVAEPHPTVVLSLTLLPKRNRLGNSPSSRFVSLTHLTLVIAQHQTDTDNAQSTV